MVLLVVGSGGPAGSGLGDGGAESVDAGEHGSSFGSVLREVQHLSTTAAGEGRGDLEQPRAQPFGLPPPRVVTGQRDGPVSYTHLTLPTICSV